MESRERPRILVDGVWEIVCTCTDHSSRGAMFPDRCAMCGGLFQILHPKPPAEGEPVAWRWTDASHRGWSYRGNEPCDLKHREGYRAEPLYAHPEPSREREALERVAYALEQDGRTVDGITKAGAAAELRAILGSEE